MADQNAAKAADQIGNHCDGDYRRTEALRWVRASLQAPCGMAGCYGENRCKGEGAIPRDKGMGRRPAPGKAEIRLWVRPPYPIFTARSDEIR